MTSPTAVDTQYAQAIKEFEELRQILPKFAAARAWMRDTDYFSHRIRNFVAPGVRITKGVRRDVGVCGVANKACNTHASVRTLTDAGNGDDAMVLTRVLMETAVNFRWMMLDQPYRLDLFCLSSGLFKRRWTQLVHKHFSQEADVVAQANAALTAEDSAVIDAAFGNTPYKWARERQPDGGFHKYSFETMIKEIEDADSTTVTKEFMYEVIYFMHSSHAHATAEVISGFRTLGREQFFTCELGFNSGHCTLALHGANTYLCWLLGQVSVYLGLRDLEAELDGWFAKMKVQQTAPKQLPATASSTVGCHTNQ
jgi:hypothetical protein